MGIADEKYVLFTTFRKSGVPVSTPVWITPLEGGRAGFWTAAVTGKAKRLAHNDAVTLQPCDSRGRVREGTDIVSATAVVVASGADFDATRRGIKGKYGFMTSLTKVLGKLSNLRTKDYAYGDRAIVITLPT